MKLRSLLVAITLAAGAFAFASPALADAGQYGSVAGTLFDHGAPVSAEVTLYDHDMDWMADTWTDGAGAFRFGAVPPGSYFVKFEPRYASSQFAFSKPTEFEADPLDVVAGAETRVDDVLLPQGTIEATVVDSLTGLPVVGACLQADIQHGEAHGGGCTDDAGLATFALRAGTYDVSIDGPGTAYEGAVVENVEVRADETTHLSVQLVPTTTIAVTVRDAHTRRPVAGACVALGGVANGAVHFPDVPCSDAAGGVRMEGYWAGTYRLFVRPTDGIHGAQWVAAGHGTGDAELATRFRARSAQTLHVTVLLDRAGTVTGVVRDAKTSAPLAGVVVSPVATAYRWYPPESSVLSNAQGRYTLGGLGPYAWPVEFVDNSGVHAWQWSGGAADRFGAHKVTVRAGGTTWQNARLPAAGAITGLIRDTTGNPVAGGLTAVNARTGDYVGDVAAFDDGVYRMSGLATQQIRIHYVVGPLEFDYPTAVSIKAGQTLAGIDLQAR